MLTASIILMTAATDSSISVELGGLHWKLCPKNRLHVVESGLIKLAKLPLPQLSARVSEYLERKSIPGFPTKVYDQADEAQMEYNLRNADIAALSRITFVGVPRYSKAKWFGPFADDDMWQINPMAPIIGEKLVLREVTLILTFAATFDGKSEFEYYSRILPRRFPVLGEPHRWRGKPGSASVTDVIDLRVTRTESYLGARSSKNIGVP